MPTATINGFKHYWEEFGAPSADAIVLLHGAAGSGRMLYPPAEALATDGWRAIVPDMRSMGRSEHVASIPPGAWVDDVKALLDHLHIQKAVVHGVSLGARIALRFGIDHPDRTRAVVVDAFIMANEVAGNAALNANLGGALSEEAKARHRANHGDDWEAAVKNYMNIRNDPKVQEHYNLRPFLAQVKLPVLIIRGDSDDVVHPMAHSVELRKAVPSSRMAIVPNNSTGVFSGSTDEFRRLLKQFVGTLAAAPAG